MHNTIYPLTNINVNTQTKKEKQQSTCRQMQYVNGRYLICIYGYVVEHNIIIMVHAYTRA